MHEFMHNLSLLHEKLTSIRFCREMKQHTMSGVDIEQSLGYA